MSEAKRAQAMESSCTGDHGTGQGKQRHLETEFGIEGIDTMRSLKRALDPPNLFNPGKVFSFAV
jgi:D-lactate dehydrogenase (cytochrome)